MIRAFVVALLFVLPMRPLLGQQKANGQVPTLQSHVELLLRWLPQNTDTVIVSQERFQIQLDGRMDHAFQRLPTSAYLFLGINRGGLWDELRDATIVGAVSGSRDPPNPTDRAPMTIEGCNILRFDSASGGAVQKAVVACMKVADREDEVAGKKVGIFNIKPRIPQANVEWTFYLANPEPTILICATDHMYLQRVLKRMDGNGAGRALPESLPEWQHVDLKAPVWGVRHYRKDIAPKAPTSPTNHETQPTASDLHGVGFVFWYDDNREAANAVTVRYLSNSTDAMRIVTQHWNRKPEGLAPRITQVAADVVEISLPRREEDDWKPFAESLYKLLWPDSLQVKTHNP